MYKRTLCFLLGILVLLRVDAGALPNFSGAVNKAVAQTVERAVIRRGFAANDPIVTATYSAIATSVTAIAAQSAAAAATAATAPVWLSVAAGLGAAAIVGGLLYGAYKVFFDDDSSEAKFVIRSSSGSPTGSVTTPSGANTYVQSGLKVDSAGHLVGSTRLRIPSSMPFNFHGISVYCDDPTICMQLAVQGWINIGGGTGAVFDVPCSAEVSAVVTCGAKRIGSGGNTQPQSSWLAGSYQFNMINNPLYSSTIKGKITDIADAIPQTELDKPADPSTIASLANMLWQRAASQSGYQGVPYSVTDPVTTADASAVKASNPSTWPSNSELISPVSSGAGQVAPISPSITPGQPATDPGSETGVGTNVNVVNTPNVNVLNKVQVDFGADPAISTPAIETTPTARMILEPLLNLFPTLKSFSVPSHESVCPRPSINLFGKNVELKAHCDLLEPIRVTLYATMAFVWTVAAMFIILRA